MGLRNVMGDVALIGSAAAAGASSGPIANPGFAADVVLMVQCAAATGTSPTLNVVLEESVDNSTWTAVAGGAAPQLTAAGSSTSNARLTKSYVRVTSTIGGTTPAITYRALVLVVPE